MQQMSGAKIDVHQNTPVGNRNDLLVEIVGPSPEIVNYAKSLVTQKVDASVGSKFFPTHCTFYVPIFARFETNTSTVL